MSTTYVVTNTFDLKIKKAIKKLKVPWDFFDKELVMIWIDEEFVPYQKWHIVGKRVVSFTFYVAVGAKVSVKEFELLKKKKKRSK